MNAQPFSVACNKGNIAVAHNGNITNALDLRRDLERDGSIFQASSDTEVILHLVARSRERTLPAALREALLQLEGAFSLVFLAQDRVIVARDPHGFRPLAFGQMELPGGRTGYVFASETCAFDLIGAVYLGDVEPGEMVIAGADGVTRERYAPKQDTAHCVFEHVYFARPDSLVFGRPVAQSRELLGRQLAREQPADADVVVPVPDSGVLAAIGYAAESGLPYRPALIRNHYVGRTFIEPSQAIRDFGVKLKLNPVRYLLKGKRVVLVDDSIVRGTTSRKIVRMVREAGAAEVHMRISCPPTISPCYYGVDTPTREELIASDDSRVRPRLTAEELEAYEARLDPRQSQMHRSDPQMERAQRAIEEIRQYLGADTLGFVSLESLRRAVDDTRGSFCTSCYTGVYPVDGSQAELESRPAVPEESSIVEIQVMPNER
jgi:amidophosphoribosyltransferase